MESKRMNGNASRWLAGLALGLAAFTVSADEVQDQFDAAMQAVEQEQFRTARNQLQSVLAVNPSLSRARLELARVYYLTMDYDQARVEAQRVLDDPNTPPGVRTTVLAFLAQIDADQQRQGARHQWIPSIYMGTLYDSNVNVGPSSDIIDIGGTPFDVLPESREQGAFGAVISPGVVHTFNPGVQFDAGEKRGAFLWQSELSAYGRAYLDESDYSFGVLTASTGPVWVVPGSWIAGINLEGNQIFLGQESLAFFTSLNPNISWQAGNSTEITLDAIVTNRHYWDEDEEQRDGWFEGATALVTHYVADGKVGLQGGVGIAHFDADVEYLSYTGPDLLAGLLYQSWVGGLVYAQVNYRGYDFDGTEPGFGYSRDDDEWRYTLGFQHDFQDGPLLGWALLGSYIYTDNDSNVPLYTYQRNEVSLGLWRSF